MSFVHLHTHTQYSLLDGAGKIVDLIARAKELEMPALAITDHGNLYGIIEFYEAATKVGIKPILGIEAYMAFGDRRTRSGGTQKDTSSHLTLLAMNPTGYRNLIALSSRAFLEGMYYKPRIDRELLTEYHEGIICLSGCAAGELARAIIADPTLEMAREIVAWYANLLGDRYYLEIMDTGLPEQKIILDGCVALSREFGVPLVATNDVHYVHYGDHDIQELLICVGTNSKLNDSKRKMRTESHEYFLKSREEMLRVLPKHEDAIQRTLEVAERCDCPLELGKRFFPTFAPPTGETSQDFLRRLCLEGLHKRYATAPHRWRDGKVGGEFADDVIARLNRELDVIEKLGFADYFLIVWDFVRFAEERGIHRTARGSGVGAIVCYALNMSHVCPLEYNLLFERFLDESRKEAPDIDIDFDDQRRDEVFTYVREKYGEDNVARIGTFGTMAAKGSVKDIGRALDVPLDKVGAINKLIANADDLEDALAKSDDLKKLYEAENSVKTLIDSAIRCEGMTRSSGTHACAVVIADKPLINYLPLALDKKNGDRVTQWEMGPVEKVGLLKMDFLGLRNLSILAQTIEIIRDTTGETLDPYSLPLDDAATYALLNRGETKGVFQLESGGIRQLLQRMRPDNFRDIIATNALYRPGPLEGGLVDDYVNIKHGRQKASYAHPIMEEVLGETHGIMVYQEQVMLILNRLGGIPLSEAYTCIKAISKKKQDLIDKSQEAFIRGAKEKGIDGRHAVELFEMIQKFAGYGFNKSHSTAYALLAYTTAYLKANYPLEFMAALLCGDIARRNFANKDATVEHLEDCKRMGIVVLPPDVNASHSIYHVDREKRTIRFALTAIKDCSESAAAAIVAAREKDGPFQSIFDLCRRIDRNACNRRVIEALIKSGSLDAFGVRRSQLFQLIDLALQSGQSDAEDRKRGQANFFSSDEDAAAPQDVIPDNVKLLAEWDQNELAKGEKEVLGMYWSSNPMTEADSSLAMYRTHAIADALALPDRSSVVLGGVIGEIKLTTTRNPKQGQPSQYANFTLEDVSGAIRSIIWPQSFITYQPLIKSESLVVATGRLDRSRCNSDEDTGNVNFIVDQVFTLDEAGASLARGFSLLIDEKQGGRQKLASLVEILRENHGEGDVALYIRLTDGTLAIFAPITRKVSVTPDVRHRLTELLGDHAVQTLKGKR